MSSDCLLPEVIVGGLSSFGQLLADQFGIQSPAFQEFVVRSLIDDPPLVHHEDSVGIANGREAMSNNQDRLGFIRGREVALNRAFGPSVQCRRWLIQQKNVRVM